jgi:hypothetical protein
MQIARLTDLCAESLAYGFEDFYGALAKYKNFEPEHVFARKDELAQAFLSAQIGRTSPAESIRHLLAEKVRRARIWRIRTRSRHSVSACG